MVGYSDQRLRRQRRSTVIRWLLIVTVVAIFGATVFWYFNPQGRPSWVSERLPTAASATTRLYRWKDANGQWMVTDQAPTEGDYEVVEYRHDANALPYDPESKSPD